MGFISSLLCFGLGIQTHCAKCSVLYQSYESTEPEKVKAILLGLEKVNRKDPGENKSESELKDF